MNTHCSCNPRPKPEVDHEAIQLYTEGDLLFEAMLKAIANAQKQVWMETYIFADDEVGECFAHALAERAKAGVQVRLLVDALGSLFQFYRTLGPKLERSGVEIHHFHRWQWREPLRYNCRDHRKLLVVDSQKAFLGGFNIHCQSSQRYYGAARWRDSHASFQGDLAQQAAELFDAFWCGDRQWLPKDNEPANSVLVPHTSDVRLARWAANAVYARLLDAGVKIFEYLPRMLHAKVAIVDGKWATLGTANLNYRSLFQNYELNLVSRDPDFCHRLQIQFEADLTEASAVCATRWRQRRWVP